MKQAFAKVAELMANNAVHRSGVSMGEINPLRATSHLLLEAGELLNDIVFYKGAEKIKFEAADCAACIIHICLLLNINEEELEAAIIQKLELRFSC